MANLFVQQQPGQYRQLATALSQDSPYQNYSQPQQQQQMPSPPAGLMNQFIGGGGESAVGGPGTSGASGNSAMSAIASNPYTWLAALLAYKAYDTKKEGGIGYGDQLENISKAPMSDFDRWGLDKYAPLGGGDIYKSSFELASGDFSNWWDKQKSALKEIRGIF